jgi:GlpG protein
MHLAFNMVMFYQLASMIEHRRGSLYLALLMLAIAVPSNLAQALVPNEWGGTVYFVGLSGVVFGLLGYLWMKSRFDPASGLYINRGTVLMSIIFLGLGFAGFFNVGSMRIANWVHGVGFATGILIGYIPTAFRK